MCRSPLIYRKRSPELATLAVALVAFVLSSATAYGQSSVFRHKADDGSITFSDAPIRNGKVVRTRYKGTIRTPT